LSSNRTDGQRLEAGRLPEEAGVTAARDCRHAALPAPTAPTAVLLCDGARGASAWQCC